MTYVVESITNKTVNTKFGPKPAYSIKANGEWFSVGFNKPKFNVGDTVDFMYEDGTYGKQVDAKTIRLISKGDPSAPAPTSSAAPAAPRSFGPPAKVFPVPLLHGDRSIIRQNALTNAREMVSAFYKPDMPVEKLLRHVPKDMDNIVEEIIRIARKFEEYSAGDIERRKAEEGSE